MYIRKIKLNNIRAISNFEMDFAEGMEAGWHVIIGDNGAGKSSIVRAIAMLLIGPEQIRAVFPVWDDWLTLGQDRGSIQLEIVPNLKIDKNGKVGTGKNKSISSKFSFERNSKEVDLILNKSHIRMNDIWSNNEGWFSAGYGSFRRVSGGVDNLRHVFRSAPKLGAHLSLFNESITFIETLEWVKELDRRRLIEKENIGKVEEASIPYKAATEYYGLLTFINSGLLPHHSSVQIVNIDGDLVFKDGNGRLIKITELSDGYRSILSLTFDLIRQLVEAYGSKATFANILKSKMLIDLPGVVLIDEIDAHLHPTWQTRIGQWFIKHFPNLQFIVTTHSPLICRGCLDETGQVKGSIWRLTAPGQSQDQSGQLDDVERDRLIFGNVLDAYGTEVFGENVERSSDSLMMLKELAKLDKLFTFGQITPEQNETRLKLQKIFTTDVVPNI